jgi:hypothetical protein
MIHMLTLGHFDPSAILRGEILIQKALNLELVYDLLEIHGHCDEDGNYSLEGHPVRIENGYIVCPWLMPATINATREFAKALYSQSHCLMADVERRRLISPSTFLEPPQPEEVARLIQTVMGKKVGQ